MKKYVLVYQINLSVAVEEWQDRVIFFDEKDYDYYFNRSSRMKQEDDCFRNIWYI